MTFDPIKITLARESGLSAVCCLCTKFWAARDRGVPGSTCLAALAPNKADHCGGPLVGKDFPAYDGPLKGALNKLCFVCGEVPKFGVRLLDTGRPTQIVGVCMKHLRMLAELRPTEAEAVAPRFEVLTEDGHLISLKPEAQTKSVARAIHEVESYYAKKEGREPDL